eukprot:11146213-Alexandrium_andersonii.AAC.1
MLYRGTGITWASSCSYVAYEIWKGDMFMWGASSASSSSAVEEEYEEEVDASSTQENDEALN